MKKFVELQCSVCKRTKDSLVNLTHYAPDRCTITLNCEGRLGIINYTGDGTSIPSVPPIGLTNWRARGSSLINNSGLQDTVLYDTSTGAKKQIVIAVSNADLGYTLSAQSTFTLNMIAEQQTAKDFRQYTYRKTGIFTVLNGVEDSQAKKVLRYDLTAINPDVVEVYVNGVKRTRGTLPSEYQVYNGSINSAVPPNSVLFNSDIFGLNQIDVIVTKASTISEVSLVFYRAVNDESRRNSGAWEGIAAVKSAAVGQFSLFYCDFAEDGGGLALGIKLRINEQKPSFILNTSGDQPTLVSNAVILLSRTKLYTQLDRQRSQCVKLSKLVTNTDYLVVKLVDGVRTLLVTENSATDVFPIFNVIRFAPAVLQTSNLLGNADAVELENTVIIGPDA